LSRPWDILDRGGDRGWDEVAFGAALADRRIHAATFAGIDYYRFDKDDRRLARGTVVVPGLELVHEYPHLPRVLHLRRGLEANLAGRFHVEEKIDGYNVRVLWARDRALAFSRGGYVCPFATDRLPDFPGVVEFVRRHPRRVLCVEVAGPGNPYNLEHPPYVPEDVRFYAFDVQEQGTGRLVPPEEKYALLDGAGLETPRRFGVLGPDEPEKLHAIVEGLDAEGCEGVVLKPPDGSVGVKYVGLGTNARDLAVTTNLIGSIPRAFIVNRLVQAAFVLAEWRDGGGSPADYERLGRAVLGPIEQALRAVEAGGEVEERFDVKLREEANADLLVKHLDRQSASVQMKLLEKTRTDDGRWRLVFVKKHQRATGFFRSRLLGASFVD